MEKIRISQDTLFSYITEHNIKLVRLAKTAGISEATLNLCFHRTVKSDGGQHVFSLTHLKKINDAIEQIANELRELTLSFGSDQMFTNKHGRTYDPKLVEPMKRIGVYFNITALFERVLGWNKNKKEATLVTPSSRNYGHISEDDVNKINAELLSIAGVLSGYRVVPDSCDTPAVYKDDHACEKRSEDAGLQPWKDTSLPLDERYRRFHEVFAEGIIFFRVNNGYTVAQDDSALVCSFDATLHPYTDPVSGVTTTYIDADTFDIILPRCVSKELRVAITDMYGE